MLTVTPRTGPDPSSPRRCSPTTTTKCGDTLRTPCRPSRKKSRDSRSRSVRRSRAAPLPTFLLRGYGGSQAFPTFCPAAPDDGSATSSPHPHTESVTSLPSDATRLVGSLHDANISRLVSLATPLRRAGQRNYSALTLSTHRGNQLLSKPPRAPLPILTPLTGRKSEPTSPGPSW